MGKLSQPVIGKSRQGKAAHYGKLVELKLIVCRARKELTAQQEALSKERNERSEPSACIVYSPHISSQVSHSSPPHHKCTVSKGYHWYYINLTPSTWREASTLRKKNFYPLQHSPAFSFKISGSTLKFMINHEFCHLSQSIGKYFISIILLLPTWSTSNTSCVFWRYILGKLRACSQKILKWIRTV